MFQTALKHHPTNDINMFGGCNDLDDLREDRANDRKRWCLMIPGESKWKSERTNQATNKQTNHPTNQRTNEQKEVENKEMKQFIYCL